MTTGEVPISRINPGDSVFYDGAIRVVRGRISVSHPPRTILLTEDDRSISLTDGTLIERVATDALTSAYMGPSWVCGMPEKVEVGSLDPGDLVLEPNAEVVTGRIRLASGVVLLTADVGEHTATHVRLYRSSDRLRLMAKGIVDFSGIGALSIYKAAAEVSASEIQAPSEIVLDRGPVDVVEISRSDGIVAFVLKDGTSITRDASDAVISLQPVPLADPSLMPSGGPSLHFRCANGHVTTVAQALDGDQRFIDCPNCGLPATAQSPSSAASSPTSPERPGPATAKFCGNCGRPRKPNNAFCTGCGKRFSKLDTTGFSS